MKTSAKDLRTHTRRILEAVERGEDVIITHRGKPRAKVVGVRGKRPSVGTGGEEPLFGIWKDYEAVKDVEAYVERLRSGPR